MTRLAGGIDYDLLKEILASGEGKIVIVDSDGNIVGDISLSALRDALKGANNKDFSTLEDDVESILAKLDVALSTRASESTLLDIKANSENLDIALSAHRDALKPTRTAPEQVLSSQSINAGDKAEFTVSDMDGYSAIAVTVKATYDSSATDGVRVRWLYSPDGTNFDSPEDAEDQGNYEDLTFSAGETRQRTVLIPVFQPHVKVQVVNLDSSYPVIVDVWKTLVR